MSCLRLGALCVTTAALCGALIGCAAKQTPMLSALTDLTFETRTTRGALLTQSEVVSISGLTPVPDVGVQFHFTDPTNASSAIGLSSSGTIKVTGVVGAETTYETVADVRRNLLLLQNRSAAGIKVLVRIAALQDEAHRMHLWDTPGQRVPEQASIEHYGKIVDEVAALERQLEAIDQQIAAATAELDKHLSKPGLMIARWAAKRTAEGEMKAGGAGVSAGTWLRSSDSYSGFVILGGIRIGHLFLGPDFADYVESIASHPLAYEMVRRHFSLTVSVVQAKCVAYVQDTERLHEVAAEAEIDLQRLAASGASGALAAQARVRYYESSVEQLANTAGLAGIRWTQSPMPFRSPDNGLRGLETGEDGWITLVSRSISLQDAPIDEIKALRGAVQAAAASTLRNGSSVATIEEGAATP